MSASNTLRFFANGRRLSTAVRVKDGYTLQVYPMRQRFADEDDWRSYWEQHSLVKPIIRVEGLISRESTNTERSMNPSFECSECLLGPGFDHRNCIVLKYKGSIEEWSNAGKIKNTSVTTSRPKPKEHSWTCCICGLPPGNDHRMCIAVGFHGSRNPVQDWERESGVRHYEVPESAIPKNTMKKGWTYTPTKTTTLQAGRYYIGDLCYALGDQIYHGVYGANDYESGLYTKVADQLSFFVSDTAFGDGVYYGTDGKEFGVDAGIIGICHEELMDQDGVGGHMYDFNEPVKCTFRAGRFRFQSGDLSFSINTN